MSDVPRTPAEYRAWWAENTDVPYGFCWCGCGRETTIAAYYETRAGVVKGEPRRYLRAHASIRQRHLEAKARVEATRPPRDGFCGCGCGERVGIATETRIARDQIKGEPLKFVRGHQNDHSAPPYEVRDLGYRTPCWIWLRRTDEEGYGLMWANGTLTKADRVYYEREAMGPSPPARLRHRCEQTGCVNPGHLRLVTHPPL